MDVGSHDAVGRLAALILVIGGAIFTALSLRTRPVPPGPAATSVPESEAARAPSVRRSLILVMAGLSGGAAVIHLVAAPPHFAEIGDLAGGFVLAAAFQALWIRWCLAGPSRLTVAVGIAVNLALVGVWVWTRTVGLPAAGILTPEAVGYPDAAAVAFELLLVGLLVVRRLELDDRVSRRAGARTLASVAVVPVVSLVLVLTSLATLAIATGLDHGLPVGVDISGMSSH